MRIDLHGYHIHTAWQLFNRQITAAYYNNNKKCVVITGQGAMMNEIQTWAHNHSKVRECTQHPKNPGSFTIKLKKKG